ncbi:MAG: endopeptidase La [Clostridia bacterium]|nr:endopeptidase La [Clostridia bacterium]MBR3564573.1 endopeptidase La [Clostridia bacterium]MBR6822021.1 endopeptidase La [Clostridia bacterium]
MKVFDSEKTYTVPMIPVRGIVVMPNSIINLQIERNISKNAIKAAAVADNVLFLASQKSIHTDSPDKDDIFETGVLCEVSHSLRMPDGTMRLLANGICRAKLVQLYQGTFYSVDVRPLDEIPIKEESFEAYRSLLRHTLRDYMDDTGNVGPDALYAIDEIKDQKKLIDTVINTFVKDFDARQEMLEILDVEERYKALIRHISRERDIAVLENELSRDTRIRLDKMQRDAYIREQIHILQESLGETDENDSEIDGFRDFIDKMPVEDDIKEKLMKEADRMERMNPQSPDYNVLLNYFEWITALPYGIYTEDTVDLKRARKVLDDSHFGMEKVKDRILEYLSVFELTGRIQGNILCFVGPPGVGKTSIARAIAEALGRKFVRMSLGGLKDESEIRGHRRTYIGAVPGRIVSNIRRAGTMNPVFLLDEIDKMASDYRGDPTSAMLEVLDESVNSTFQDNYLDIDFDLSQVMFICTANNAEDIPAPLYDRLEIIELESYTPYEKKQIAIKHLIPKELEKNGLTKKMLKINPSVISEIISEYTLESGVRSLEREIGIICRKAAREYVETGEMVKVGVKDLTKYLGKQKYFEADLPSSPKVGVAIGLAWTAAGGTTLPIEVSSLEGSGNIELTGQLGDVMKESAKTAFSYVRSVADKYGLSTDFYKTRDLHIHAPEGAVPKDGPSAGVTMALAILSALTGRKIRRDIAMTGEITLIGRVLAIGGLREKAFAAYRAKIHEIIIPKDNERDIDDIPEEIRQKLVFHPVSDASEVIKLGLMEK